MARRRGSVVNWLMGAKSRGDNLQFIIGVVLLLYFVLLVNKVWDEHEPATAQLRNSLVLNVILFVTGIVIFFVIHPEHIYNSESHVQASASKRKLLERGLSVIDDLNNHTSAENYLLYLQVCVYSFFTTFVVDFLCIWPWDYGKTAKRLFFTVTSAIDLKQGHDMDWALRWRFGISFINGVIALFYIKLFRSLMQTRVQDPDAYEKMQRTIWLQALPKEDRQTGQAFKLTKSDITKDVKLSITRVLNKQFGGGSSITDADIFDYADELRALGYTVEEPKDEAMASEIEQPVVEECQVCIKLDAWSALKYEEILAGEKKEIYRERFERAKTEHDRRDRYNLCYYVSFFYTKMWVKYYGRKTAKYEERLEKVQAKLRKLTEEFELSGSAFVTFTEKKHADDMLGVSKKVATYDVVKALLCCYSKNRNKYFRFGRAPFRTVTLRVARAPAPEDIEWCNLQYGSYWRNGMCVFAGVLVFILMLFLTTLVTASAFVGSLDEMAEENVNFLRNVTERSVFNNRTKESLLTGLNTVDNGVLPGLFAELPTMSLLAINSLILPSAIERIGSIERSQLKSKFEMHQMDFNYGFMILNTFVFPVLGVTGLGAATYYFWSHSARQGLIKALLGKLDLIGPSSFVNVSGLYSVKYLFNCAFLSSIFQLLNMSQVAVKALSRRCVITKYETEEIDKTWPFAWGYWYAWTLSIYFMTTFLSILLPSLLPIATIFFFIKYHVDKYNLRNKVYTSSADSEGQLAIAVIRSMRRVIGHCWLLLAIVGWVLSSQEAYDVCFFRPASVWFMLMTLIVYLWSYLGYESATLNARLGFGFTPESFTEKGRNGKSRILTEPNPQDGLTDFCQRVGEFLGLTITRDEEFVCEVETHWDGAAWLKLKDQDQRRIRSREANLKSALTKFDP